jgi:hypothetical protein
MAILSYQLEWDQGGSTWVALVGDSPDSLATSFEVTGLTTGQAYSFRYLVRNEVAFSPAGPILLTYAAVTPSQLSAPATSIDGLGVLIDWDPPNSAGGLAITGYKVYIRASDSTYTLETANCDVVATQCTIPLLTLQAPPYSLALGDLV